MKTWWRCVRLVQTFSTVVRCATRLRQKRAVNVIYYFGLLAGRDGKYRVSKMN